MYQYMKTIIFVLVLILSLFAVLYFGKGYISSIFFQETKISSQNNDKGSTVLGSQYPYFNLESNSGTNINSVDTAGSPLVITFWTTWNTDSIDQIKILDDYSLSISKEDRGVSARILLINSQESKEVVYSMIRRGGYDLDVLLDKNGEVSNLYGVHTLPTTFFIDKNGKIIEIFVGTLSRADLIKKMEGIIF